MALIWFEQRKSRLYVIEETAFYVFWYLTHPHPLTPTHLEQNVCRFAKDIFICIFVNDKIYLLIKMSPKFVPKGPIDNNPALVYLNQCWHDSLTHICCTKRDGLSVAMALLLIICVMRSPCILTRVWYDKRGAENMDLYILCCPKEFYFYFPDKGNSLWNQLPLCLKTSISLKDFNHNTDFNLVEDIRSLKCLCWKWSWPYSNDHIYFYLALVFILSWYGYFIYDVYIYLCVYMCYLCMCSRAP